MMKICFITPSVKIGGYEKFILNLIEGLTSNDKETESIVIAINGIGELKTEFENKCSLEDLGINRSRYCFSALRKKLIQLNPNIVYVAFSNLIIPVYIIKKLFKLNFKIVIGEHGFSYYNNRVLKYILKKIYDDTNCIIAVSHEVKIHICNHLKVNMNKVIVINNPVINSKSDKLLLEEYSHKWIGKHKIILALGRIAEDKGFQDLLKAYSLIKNEVNAKIIIAGEGEYKKTLKILANKLGILEDVDFIGYINNPFKVMKNSDIFVLTSKAEGFGNVLVEALYSNTNIISYDCLGGPKEILENGKYGILITQGNIELLSKTIRSCLENNICFQDKKERANDYKCTTVAKIYKESFINILMEEKMENKISKVASFQLNKKIPKVINYSLEQLIKMNLLRVAKKINYIDINKFYWHTALLLIGKENAFKVNNNWEEIESVKTFYDNLLKSKKKGLTLINDIDQIMNGYTLLYLKYELNINKYDLILDDMIRFIESLISQAKNDILPYRISEKDLILIDTLGIVCPFLARYSYYKKDEKYEKLCVKQIISFIENAIDENTLLPFHSYRLDDLSKGGIIGWGRGIGWLLIGIVDSLEYLKSNTEEYKIIKSFLESFVDNIVKYQSNEGYFTWCLTLDGADKDTSSTAFIGYGIARAIELDLISKRHIDVVYKTYKAIINSCDNVGNIHYCSEECGGVGSYSPKFSSKLSNGIGLACISVKKRIT